MTRLFTAILNMSITASYVALAVIVIRILLKKMPKVFSYILWSAVLIRLVCPYSFNSIFSFLSFLRPNFQANTGTMEYIPYNIGLMQSPVVNVGSGRINHAINSSLSYATPTASVNPMQIQMEIASIIWGVGIVLLFIYSVISYLKVTNNVKTATLVKGNIFETDRIATPFLCGFIKPKIYVPVGISENDRSYIVAHEQTHIKRLDYIIKPFAFLVLIIHWFNPLMWVSFRLMSKDMEMSCDESVIKKMGSDVKGNYSKLLLSLSVKRSGLILGSPLAFGESNIKSRIKNILNYRKPTFWVSVIAIVVIGVLIVGFTTNPKHEQNNSTAYLESPTKTLVDNKTIAKMPENNQIENYLNIIMSSPQTSSNPRDYIEAHSKEYQSILKMGDEALNYLFAQFETCNNNDLKSYIMMDLCNELLGDRNNVANEGLSPQDWFKKLSPYKELPDFKANVSDTIEQLVYDAAVQKYSRLNEGFTVVAPTIFGSYEEKNKLKVFVTVYSNRYKLYNKTLFEVGGSIIPAAITYTKDNNGKYTLQEYKEPMDGSYFSKTIKDFCTMPVSGDVIKGLHPKIMKDYGSNKSRNTLLIKNLIKHLKDNNQKDINLKGLNDELIPLT